MFFISAPFGNYLKFKDTTRVTGTWTIKPRPGLFKQIIKTLRYVKTDQGRVWRNQLGLRNPGLKHGMFKTSYDDVLSIAAIDKQDWNIALRMISPDRNIELNISCPNLGSHEDTTAFEGFDLFPNHMRGKWCIVKVPPTSSNKLLDKIVERGYNHIHASNTLYTPQGGLSGQVLVEHTLRIIDYCKKEHPHVEIIAGGGVRNKQDVTRYKNAGADHISLGTVCFTPWKVTSLLK